MIIYFVTRTGAVPRDGTWDGVIVDDHVVARQVPRSAAYQQSPESGAFVRAYGLRGRGFDSEGQ